MASPGAGRGTILTENERPERDPASFRDPAGFVYRRDGTIYRQVNRAHAGTWDDLEASGLLRRLQHEGLLVDHEPIGLRQAAEPELAHVILRPDPLDFISYPYEWSFGQLKDAATLTLVAQGVAAAAGFTMRDASAYNVQFQAGKPILIDSLSFERAVPGTPWTAYRQFCEQFLAPLALMARVDVRCGLLLQSFIDGIPIDLAATLLPGRTRIDFGLATHIHAHAAAQRRYGSGPPGGRGPTMGPLRQAALLDSLLRTVERLDWRPGTTEWAGYADATGYGDTAARSKDSIVERFLGSTAKGVVWDIGANTGRFSAIAARLGHRVVAWDFDAGAVELHYRTLKAASTSSILPLVADIANPSPAIGWAGAERRSLLDRADADTVLALALVHHLAIGRNIPLRSIVEIFAKLGRELIVEFIPKTDPMVGRLLANREDVFPDYTGAGFGRAFGEAFDIVDQAPVEDSQRSLFRMRRRP
jgi:ribosomal protein L11 methylase PrmA